MAPHGIGMVNPGFLKNDNVIEWLDGVEPYWSYLEFDSYCRLRRKPGEDDRALRLAVDLTAAEVHASPIVAATLRQLRMAEGPRSAGVAAAHAIVAAGGAKASATAVDDEFVHSNGKACVLERHADEMGDGPTTRIGTAVNLPKDRRR